MAEAENSPTDHEVVVSVQQRSRRFAVIGGVIGIAVDVLIVTCCKSFP